MAEVRTHADARRAAVAAVALSLAITGCTYEDREPGLLDGDARSRTPPANEVSSPPRPPLPAPNADLPVADERSWTSADGLQIQVRIAVHAVRRLAGATVLDWSVTPIEGPNLRPGDLLPEGFDLGLSRPGDGVPNILLVDAPRRVAYRPLRSTRKPHHCLCTPVLESQRTLRIGVTRMLQTAYPDLPAGLSVVDVSIATVPQFSRVPVLAAGLVPVAAEPTDLTRPADAGDPAVSTSMFRYGPDEQVFRLRVRRVLRSSTFTSLEWEIVSVTGGRGVEAASTPPFARRDATGTGHNPIVASGPTVRAPGLRDPLRALRLTTDGDPDELGECLCTDLRGWPSVLRRPDKLATVVTNYPALPLGTRQVEVAFHGHPSLSVAVSQAVDVARQNPATVPGTSGQWRFLVSGPRTGWNAGDWPTPVPEPDQLESYESTVDRVLR